LTGKGSAAIGTYRRVKAGFFRFPNALQEKVNNVMALLKS